MSLFMETTKISAGTTVGEIQRILGVYGAAAVMTQYENKEVVAISFQIIYNDRKLPFVLPCRWRSIYNVLLKRRKRVRAEDVTELEEQARRVAWRQILRWVEAQLALVDTEMVKIQEVFLPYVQIDLNGRTLYQEIEGNNFLRLGYKQ